MAKKDKSKDEKVAPQEDVYEMEDIIEFQIKNGQEQFRVKWKGYSVEDSTWEPKENILNPGDNLEIKMVKLRDDFFDKKGKQQPSSPPAQSKSKRRRLDSNATSSVGGGDASSISSSQRQAGGAPAAASPPKTRRTQGAERTSKGGDTTAESKRDSAATAAASPKVTHIARNSNSELTAAIQHPGCKEPTWVSVEEARMEYPQELLDYLLSRIRFREAGMGKA